MAPKSSRGPSPGRGGRPPKIANPFAEFAAPPAEGSFQPGFPLRFRARERVVEIQDRIESALPRPQYLYAHWWFAWELVRRSEREWNRLKTASAVAGGLLPAPRSRRRSRLVEDFRRIGAAELWFARDDGVRRFRPLPPRGFRFRAPNADGTGPPGSRNDEEQIRLAFEAILLPPVILADAVHAWPGRVPSADYVCLFVHRDAKDKAVDAALKVLRSDYGPWKDRRRQTWVEARSDVWGDVFSPSEAVEILDARATGRPRKPLVAEIIARPDRHGFADFDQAVQAARRLEGRLLRALRTNALTTLVGDARDRGTPA